MKNQVHKERHKKQTLATLIHDAKKKGPKLKQPLFALLAGTLVLTGCGDDTSKKESSKSPKEEVNHPSNEPTSVELTSEKAWRPTLSMQPWHLNRVRWENARGKQQAVLKTEILGYSFTAGQPAIRGYTYGYEALQKQDCETPQDPELSLTITTLEDEKKTVKSMKLNEEVDLGPELHLQHDIEATITNPGNCTTITWSLGIMAHRR